MNHAVTCPYCQRPAMLVAGDAVYPHRPDLHQRYFWLCRPCDAHVGCHPPSRRWDSDGTRPLGTLANARLRALRSHAHSVFDPLWQRGHFASRRAAYRWLSQRLGIAADDCHIGHMDVAQCIHTITAVNRLAVRLADRARVLS